MTRNKRTKTRLETSKNFPVPNADPASLLMRTLSLCSSDMPRSKLFHFGNKSTELKQ